MKEPKVSILMPVYKGDKYLQDAVDSILNQTFKDFEFIIICDDPTDETRCIFDLYQQNDSRMKIYYQGRQGLVNSLNRGFSLAKGEYIVRMDADDISLPKRLEKQVEFMDNNPEIGISGTWVKIIGDVPQYVLQHPCKHESIKSSMLFFCPIAHPSVILRKETFCKSRLHYNQDENYAEDYGLWVRAVDMLKFANIPEVHLHYRMHTSTTNSNIQEKASGNIRLSQIKKFGINPTQAELEIHEALCYHDFKMNQNFILRVKSWLEKLQAANSKMNVYPEPAFSNVLANYWYDACCNSINLGLGSWHLFCNSNLYRFSDISYRRKLRLFYKPNLKCLINRINNKDIKN